MKKENKKQNIVSEQIDDEREKIKKIIKIYEEKKGKFNEFRPKDEEETLKTVQDLIAKIQKGQENKGFESWTGDVLYDMGVKLSQYYYHLLYYAAEHNARSSFVYSYRKLSHAQAFRPLKAKMKQIMDKVTETDVESELQQMLEIEIEMQIYEQRQADIFKSLASSTEKMITFVQQRISDMRTEKGKFIG